MTISISGGKKIDKILKDLQKKAGKKAGLKVGILEGSTNLDGESIAMYGAVQEYGSGDMAPKPFMRTTSMEKNSEWVKNLAHLVKGQGFDLIAALEVVGDIAAKDIQDTIQNWPGSNSPATQAAKEKAGYGSQVLVWEGDLIRAIDFEVVS